MKKTFREKINRDDGNFYRIGNRTMNTFEVIGYGLVLLALLVFLVVNKLAVGSVWVGWGFFMCGLLLVGLGAKRAPRQD